MNENERQKFVQDEIQAIYEEFDKCFKQLILLKDFLQEVSEVANGAEPNYELIKARKAKK